MRMRAGFLGVHVAAVDGDVLPGNEVTFGAGEENEGAKKILGLFVTLNGPACDCTRLRRSHMPGILLHDRIAHREPWHQRVDPNPEPAEFTRERARDDC